MGPQGPLASLVFNTFQLRLPTERGVREGHLRSQVRTPGKTVLVLDYSPPALRVLTLRLSVVCYTVPLKNMAWPKGGLSPPQPEGGSWAEPPAAHPWH